MKSRLDIAIVGAGVAGLLAAVLLQRARGARVTVVDLTAPEVPQPDDDIALRVSALSPGSLERLAEAGVGEILRARAGIYREMRVWDAAGSSHAPDALYFSAAEMALPELGLIVEDAIVRAALFEAATEAGVVFRFGAAVAGLDRTGNDWQLTLDGGETLSASLVVAADGGRSALRRMAGIDVREIDYEQRAVVTHVRPARQHEETAWQRFLPGGPVALLPLADGRVSVVWSLAAEDAETMLGLEDTAFCEALAEASDHVLGSFEPGAPRAAFPLRAGHASRYVDAGFVLVGDAAHTVHPLAGQGANLGIADAHALAGIVEAALAAGEYPADLPVLRRYERARRGANAAMLTFIDTLNRLFAARHPLGASVRRTGMQLFNRIGPLKRQAMRVALGL